MMPEIFLCSFGLKLEHITFETLETLRKMDIIFLQAFDLGIEKFFKNNDVKARLVRLKQPERGDFSAIAEAIISAAVKGKSVAVLSYGFPTFINGLYESLKNKADGRVKLETVYSVGSINPLLELAGISDIPAGGLHFFNSLTPLFLRKIDEKKHFPCFIFNPHRFLSREMRKPFLAFSSRLKRKGFSFYLLEAASAGGHPCVSLKVEFKVEKDLLLIGERATLFINRGH